MKLRGSEMVELKKEEEVVVVGDKEVKGNEVSEISPVVATTIETTSVETKGEESSNVNPDSVYIVYSLIILFVYMLALIWEAGSHKLQIVF